MPLAATYPVGTYHADMTDRFSVLMSVYANDDVEHFRRAILSNCVEQTRVPSQMVIVRDGPVPAPLQACLDSLPAMVADAFDRAGRVDETPDMTLLPLGTNAGLAHALNVGLTRCRYDIVARADSDDISLPDRFAREIPLLESHRAVADEDGADSGPANATGKPYDIVGSAIREFTQNERGDELLGQIRALPTGGGALMRYARSQSPLNHPSVAFRKSAVLEVGGYPEGIGRFEDYLLWERLILHGARLRNLDDPLVLYRVDAGSYQRRGGFDMWREEIRLQRRFHRDGFTTTEQFLRNVAIRSAYRLLPTGIRRFGYRLVTKLRGRRR